jgi:hypothetical protein
MNEEIEPYLKVTWQRNGRLQTKTFKVNWRNISRSVRRASDFFTEKWFHDRYANLDLVGDDGFEHPLVMGNTLYRDLGLDDIFIEIDKEKTKSLVFEHAIRRMRERMESRSGIKGFVDKITQKLKGKLKLY